MFKGYLFAADTSATSEGPKSLQAWQQELGSLEGVVAIEGAWHASGECMKSELDAVLIRRGPSRDDGPRVRR